MLMRGGFAGLAKLDPSAGALPQARRAERRRGTRRGWRKDADIAELAEKHFAELKALLDQFAEPTTPYSVAAFPEIREPLCRLRPSGAGQGMVGDRRRRRRTAQAGRGDEPAASTFPALLRDAQATASDPRASAWVSANAGSGKTHVLTQRVLRLLLDGAPPAQILGLTFTKAAAANMASRIFRDARRVDDASTTRSWRGRSARPERAGPARRTRIRAAIVRPHDRDAGRPQDPDAARLLRAAAAALPLRGQRPRAFQGRSTSARPPR